jgi:hypothetical protein
MIVQAWQFCLAAGKLKRDAEVHAPVVRARTERLLAAEPQHCRQLILNLSPAVQ